MDDKLVAQSRAQNLGSLIKLLMKLPPDAGLVFGDGTTPDGLESYRGYYEDLAITRREPEGRPVRVDAFLALCRETVGQTMQGYKGGDYLMGLRTSVWVSQHGESSGTRCCGVQALGDGRVLILGCDVDRWHDPEEV